MYLYEYIHTHMYVMKRNIVGKGQKPILEEEITQNIAAYCLPIDCRPRGTKLEKDQCVKGI